MLLYHGSSERHLEAILKDGIKPRGRKDGNWKGTVKSNASAVYLTDAYPLHFAESAAKDKERLAVFEIETKGVLDIFRFAPDEDLLEQGTRKDERFAHVPGTKPYNMKKRTQWFRDRALDEFGHMWPLSLEKMGTVCYHGPIPASAITRYVLIKSSVEVIMASDPVICPLNYMFMGAYYRQLTKMLFGDKPDTADMSEWDAQKLLKMYENPADCLLKDCQVVAARKEAA